MLIRHTGFFLALILILLSSSQSACVFGRGEQYHRPSRMPTGYDWDKMTEGERFFFVFGYRIGHSLGYNEACDNVYQMIGNPPLTEEDNLGYRCVSMEHKRVLTPEKYMEQISTFYSRYPELSLVSLYALIDLLSPERGLTLEDIAKMAREGFPRKQIPNDNLPPVN